MKNCSLCIVINSCKTYFGLIPSLIDNINKIDPEKKFPRSNIFIISGQEDQCEEIVIQGITTIRVEYTGLHLTSYIYISENIQRFSQFDYFLMIPDTIEFGSEFFHYLEIFCTDIIFKNTFTSYPLTDWNFRDAMDIGIVSRYHFEYIYNYLQFVKVIKPYDLDRLKKLKYFLIVNENVVLGLSHEYDYNRTNKLRLYLGLSENDANNIFFKNDYDQDKISPICTSPRDVQETIIITQEDKKLQRVFIKKLDLYKFQRNFCGPHSTLILDP